ncbi:hypothetical protein D3C78_189480 [compost metagenome]
MENTAKTLESMNEDSDLRAKRKLLIIISVLLMAMSVSGATLLEANTFIFKIGFSNTEGLGYLLFIGNLTLTVRYYSVAYQYHVKLYDMWANEMISDSQVFGYTCDDDHYIYPRGLLSKIEVFSKGFNEFQRPEENELHKFVLKYEVSGLFMRAVSYECDMGEYHKIERVSLSSFGNGWGYRDFFKILKFELKYQSNALFRRAEYLEILLPYIISILSMLSFIFKTNIQAYIQ